jgi:hypothetical protein
VSNSIEREIPDGNTSAKMRQKSSDHISMRTLSNYQSFSAFLSEQKALVNIFSHK